MIVVLSIINYVAGFWGIAIGLFIFPVTLLAALIYVIFEFGDFSPIIIIYGGGILSTILVGIGSLILNE